MIRVARIALPLLAAAVLASPGHGQTPSPLAPERENPQPATPAPKPKRDRPISDNLASMLAASMPKYNPPPKPRPEDEQVDLREVDKPRNTIIRLPRYVVRDKKPPVFRERDIYDQRSRTDLALLRYSGLQVGNILGLNRPIAFMMYQEEERLQNMEDLEDTADAIGRGDPAAGDYIKRTSDQTFMRNSGFGSIGREP